MRAATLALLALALCRPVSGAAQQLDPIRRDVGHAMLDAIHFWVDSLYFDSTFGGKRNEAEFWWEGKKAVDRATTLPEMLASIAQSLQTLDDSHTRFLPPYLTVAADYGWDWMMVGDQCYVRLVDRGSDAYQQGLRAGDRVLLIDRNVPTRKSLPLIGYVYHDLSPVRAMRVTVEREGGPRQEIALQAKITQRPVRFDPNDLETLRMVEYAEERASAITHRWRTFDSVAVWSMSAFGFQDRRIDEHLAQARRYPWLVLDLRGNPGGALEGVHRLLGHFTDTALVVFTQRFRDSTTADTVRPGTRPRGRYAGRVIVLVDSESASSSEIVAWTLQHTMGATILGDRTAGQVRGSVVIPRAVRGDVRVLFGVQVSIFDVVMPDGTRLERLGVSPDRLVLPTASDLAEGRDPVLQAALALAAGN